MGLDITAYSNVELTNITPDEYEEDSDLWETHSTVYDYTDTFLRSRMDNLQPGVYKVCGETHGFRAGSYGGYNQWRDQLSRIMIGVPAEVVFDNPKKYEEAPFYPLINFSDCEGVIGPQTSALLAKDFARFADKAAQVPNSWWGNQGEWWRAKYNEWRKAFELAAQSGYVDFH